MSLYVDSTSGATEHCDAMAKLHPDLAQEYEKIRKLVSEKLWHQLTEYVLNDFMVSANARMTAEGTNSFLALYDKVILAIDKKLNQLSLARMASAVSEQLDDPTAAKAILENLLDKQQQLGPAATLYVESKLALLTLSQLEQGDLTSDVSKEKLVEIKKMLEKNARILQEDASAGTVGTGTESSSSTQVHSAHYKCSMTYRKAVGPPEAFYREALQFLNYTPLKTLPKEERYQLATDLSLAALTGEGVFNFGEVVTTPILAELENTPLSWLVQLMHASAKGNVLEFQDIIKKHESQIAQQPALVHRADFLQEKITLLALVNMCFERPSSERTLTFGDVAERIHMPLEKVEWVVMRALSLGLIEGSMDQVDQTVQVTWVMPRVLDNSQLASLATRFGEWAVKVSQTKDYMGEQVQTTSTLMV